MSKSKESVADGKRLEHWKISNHTDAVLARALRWKTPRHVILDGDLFHEDVPDAWIDAALVVMSDCRHHVFQVLTKRADRMHRYFEELPQRIRDMDCHSGLDWVDLPLPNVWLGVSAERQQEADERIPDLLATPAAVRFVSCEPLLGPVNFERLPHPDGQVDALLGVCSWDVCEHVPRLDWVIVSGESGPSARPTHPDWVRAIRDQCQAAGVPFSFGGWGEYEPTQTSPDLVPIEHRGVFVRPDGAIARGPRYSGAIFMARVGKKRSGRLLDGRTWSEMPATQRTEGLPEEKQIAQIRC